MDLSGSMGYTYRQELTKFEYCISLAAALAYLMIHQQDPVGAGRLRHEDPPEPGAEEQAVAAHRTSSRCWRGSSPSDETDVAKSLHQVAGMIRHRSLVMLFSDLLGDPDPILKALHRLRLRRATT